MPGIISVLTQQCPPSTWNAVLKIKTICHARDLWKSARSCSKQLHYLCLSNPWNLPGTTLSSGFQSFQGVLKSTEWDNTKTRPTLERRKTLGHLRSINLNMINHNANQSQICQLLKIVKTIFFQTKMWKVVPSISGWTDIENPYRLSRGRIYIYIDVKFLVSHFNDLSKFTGWAIIEELSIRPTTPHISGQLGTKNSCKILLCWFIVMIWVLVCHNQIICIDMNIILDFSIAIQRIDTDSVVSKWVNTENLFLLKYNDRK